MRKEIKCEENLRCEKEDVMLGFNMKNEIMVSKPTLKDVRKSLDANQLLAVKMQVILKGGASACSNCQDIRRPPSTD